MVTLVAYQHEFYRRKQRKELFFVANNKLQPHRSTALIIRDGVEDARLEAKAKAKDSLSEDRPSRGQGQECSRPRPRTKDTIASVLKKKKLKKLFQAISNLLAYPECLIGGGLNHKSYAMTSSKFFQTGRFCETKIS